MFRDAILNDAGAEGERTELRRSCPDFWACGRGPALVAWLEECSGFAVEGGKRLASVPSAN